MFVVFENKEQVEGDAEERWRRVAHCGDPWREKPKEEEEEESILA